MNAKLFEKLKEYIIAVAEYKSVSRHLEDGGLQESIQVSRIESELEKLLDPSESAPDLAAVVEGLELIERDNLREAATEKAIGGNVVKETEYRATAAGLRIAIDVLNSKL